MSDPENPEPTVYGGSHSSPLRWIVLAIALVAGLWFGIQALRDAEVAGAGEGPGPGGAPQGPPPATVIASPVVQKPIQERRRVTGTLMAVQRADVASQETGAVEEVLVDVGDEVEEGQILVKLDGRRLRASLAEGTARRSAASTVVAERAAELERAKIDFERNESMFQQRVVSEREFLDAKQALAVAEAKASAAMEDETAVEKALELLQVRVDDLAVRAPFSGRVVERHVDPGEWLSPGSPVFTLVSSGTIEAWVQLPERFVAEVASGAKTLEIVLDGNGMRVPAESIRRVADIDPVTRLFPVVVELDDRDGTLLPGLSVHTDFPVGKEEELAAVPVDAIIETFQGASVFRVAPNPDQGMPIAERVPVEVAFRENGLVYLKSDSLKPGEQVVTEGNERLFPGTPLILGELPGDQPSSTLDEVKP